MARVLLSLLVLLSVCAHVNAQHFGISVLRPTSSALATAQGVIRFDAAASADPVGVTGWVIGLPVGQFAIYIHDAGDLSSPDGANIGEHYNPTKASLACTYGVPWVRTHGGDLLNLTVTVANANTSFTIAPLNLITLVGANSIIGRSIIIHTQPDVCGVGGTNPGPPYYLTGVIGIRNPSPNVANNAIGNDALPSPTNTFPATAVPWTEAVSVLYPTNIGAGLSGIVRFVQATPTGPVWVSAVIRGLVPNSVHALVIHTFGDDSDISNTSETLGSHYLFSSTSPIHPGLLALDATADSNGVLYHTGSHPTLSLAGATNGIIGRSITLHLTADPEVNRVLTGIIGIRDETTTFLNASPFEGYTLLRPTAYAALNAAAGASGSVYYGSAVVDGRVTITGWVAGIPAGRHAIYIHDNGDLSAPDGANIGEHFNPTKAPLTCTFGAPWVRTHGGDLGEVNVLTANANTSFAFNHELISLSGSGSIIGRSIVVHNDADICKAGGVNPGPPYFLQGVVGIRNPARTVVNNAAGNLATVSTQNTNGATPTIWTDAVSIVYPTNIGAGVSGFVTFSQATATGPVTVRAIFRGLVPNSEHAFVIHTYGDDSDISSTSETLGSHWLFVANQPNHAGLLTLNAPADAQGVINHVGSHPLLTLNGANSIIGRSITLHLTADPEVTRIVTGIIGTRDPASPNPVPTGGIVPTGGNPTGGSTGQGNHATSIQPSIVLALASVFVALLAIF
jgi:Cu-Zn family superoxide dismutase